MLEVLEVETPPSTMCKVSKFHGFHYSKSQKFRGSAEPILTRGPCKVPFRLVRISIVDYLGFHMFCLKGLR